MGDTSKIEWTDATWNPVRGCTKVSPGCKFCYAETFAERFRGVKDHPFEQGFDLRLVPEKLPLPAQWKRPRRIFVNSMSDLFHEDIPLEYIQLVFAVMEQAPQHTFQVLTKRAERLAELAPHLPWPSNVWMGVSVESQKYADERIPHLLKVPAAVRFLSMEPLLGPVDLGRFLVADMRELGGGVARLNQLHWVIVGGESGPGARPMHPDWARGVRDQCKAVDVPFFFKQWGAWAPGECRVHRLDQRAVSRRDGQMGEPTFVFTPPTPGQGHGCGMEPRNDMALVSRLGKHLTGRLLDGQEHSAFPEPA